MQTKKKKRKRSDKSIKRAQKREKLKLKSYCIKYK